ncbi:MAG: hypothetical protein K2I66_04255 [Bacteroidales bacterium]|nr:hypothetical protein [Bacteroidales bacterium]
MKDQTIDTLVSNSDSTRDLVGSTLSAWDANAWTIIAIIEFVIILVVTYVIHKKQNLSPKRLVKKKALSENVDFDNIVNSAFHAKALYDQLKVKCHPDRFVNEPARERLALELSQQISKNKNNVRELQIIKQRAIDELNINFK